MNRLESCSILNVALNRIQIEGEISSEIYALLVTLFPTVIAPTLEILDNGKVTKIQCQESKRHFYRVRDSSHVQAQKNRTAGYVSQFNGANDSECADMNHDVIKEMCFCYFFAKECMSENGGAIFCKHILASKLAEALGIAVIKEIEDKDYAPLLLGSKAHMNKFEDKRGAAAQ